MVKLAIAIMVREVCDYDDNGCAEEVEVDEDADGDDDAHDDGDDDEDDEDDGNAIDADNKHGVDAMMTIMMMVTVAMVKRLTQTGVANVCCKSHAHSYDDGAGNNCVAIVRPQIRPLRWWMIVLMVMIMVVMVMMTHMVVITMMTRIMMMMVMPLLMTVLVIAMLMTILVG